nr:ice-binding family protein [Actinomycetota bacterium]
MKNIGSSGASPRRAGYFWLATTPLVAAAVVMFIVSQSAAAGTDTTVGLGTAASYAVLAGTPKVANTGLTVINGDLGISPAAAVTGFRPGTVNGSIHAADAAAAQAQLDLTTAYNDAAGRALTANVPATIGSAGIETGPLAPGVYKATTSLEVKGALTLDAKNDPNAVFIFQVGSALLTDSASTVTLTNGAQACNVFWQVTSSATLGTESTFTGTILALSSITVTTGDTVFGRVLARNGAVTLDDDHISVPTCATGPSPSPSPTGTSPSPSPTGTSPSPSPTGTSPSPSPTGTSPSPSPT